MWVPMATARSNGGNHPICCVNGVCHKCPIDAKFTIQNGSENSVHSNLFVLTGASVREVNFSQQKAKGPSVIISGKKHVIRAQTVALATNAVNNATILTRSGSVFDTLGRFIHEQLSKVVAFDIDFDSFYGGTSITGHYYGAYAGHDRSRSAAVILENTSFPAQIRAEAGKWAQRLSLKLIAEDIPKPENRVILDSSGEPTIIWTGHSDYAFEGIASTIQALPDIVNGSPYSGHDANGNVCSQFGD